MEEKEKELIECTDTNLSQDSELQSRIDKLQETTKKRKNTEVKMKYKAGQLVLWPENERGIPNELVRCAVFSAKNRKVKREIYSPKAPLIIPLIGGGNIVFFGEELRQDDETVWMQLVHLAKESRSEQITFTPYSFLKSIHWDTHGENYDRLLVSFRRLYSAGLEIYSQRFDSGITVKLLSGYDYAKENIKKPWKVKVFDESGNLLSLFDKMYSRVDLKMRLELPDGITTWLHSFFASHKEPYAHKIETLAKGAGITLDSKEDELLEEKERIAKRKKRLNESKRLIESALKRLVETGFLEKYEITEDNLVYVTRANALTIGV